LYYCDKNDELFLLNSLLFYSDLSEEALMENSDLEIFEGIWTSNNNIFTMSNKDFTNFKQNF